MTLKQEIADLVGANVSSFQMRSEFESAAVDIMRLIEPHIELGRLLAEIEATLPNWMWLLRRDATQGYFANILTPDHQSIVECSGGQYIDRSTGMRYPAFAETPVQALRLAFEAVIAVKAQHH